MTRGLDRRRTVALALAVVAIAAFLPALRNGFVDYDDNSYITSNGIVLSGLNWNSIRWALTTSFFANWHPLTWLSHMLDCELFGSAAWGHHLVGLALHGAVAALVFLFLDESTGDRPRSAVVALLFAVHPLRVESVAWASERKDLLCGLFFILACRAHVRRVRGGRSGSWVALWALLALASKPMAVTLPLALLILDYWPLRRAETLRRLVVEKAPLFVLSAAAAVMTVLAQVGTGTVAKVPLAERAGNASLNLVRYLRLSFWPRGLVPLYLRTTPPGWEVLLSVVLVLALTAAAAALWRTRLAVTAGWAWFVCVLLPVLGLVQAGSQSVADRYTYLPHLGLFIALAWMVPDLSPRWRTATAAAVCVLAAVLGTLSWRQTRRWRDSETLFTWMHETEPHNPVGSSGLGFLRLRERRLAEAESLLQDSLRDGPTAPAYVDLGRVFAQTGRAERALEMFRRAWKMAPQDPGMAFEYANALMLAHRVPQAIEQYRTVQAAAPAYPGISRALGVALDMGGHGAEALPLLRRATEETPDDPAAHALLGTSLARGGQFTEAAAEFERALQLQPDYPGAAQALKFAREDAARGAP